ncbi:sulfide:quinone oxidoreductase, mitochondrial-like [Styela clava]
MALLRKSFTQCISNRGLDRVLSQIRLNSSYEIVIAGGGSGGISVGARLSNALGSGKVAIIEPSDDHYYQPIWTLVGAGVKPMSSSRKAMKDVIPSKATWIKDSVAKLNPDEKSVTLSNGDTISYKYLVVAMGIQLHFDRIKGLPEAFETPGVCSNYSAATVGKTLKALKNFKEGNAIFTFPNTPIKCAGAPQKIMYLADEFFRKQGNRDKAHIYFNSAGAAIFAVKKYAEALNKIVASRDITANYGLNLVEVKPDKKQAIFAKMSNPEEKETFDYEMLHITPPMAAPAPIRDSPLSNEAGFVNVDSKTLQHTKYPEVFALGDCSSLPTSKTAAAVACQNKILATNLLSYRENQPRSATYDGYTSCPLITSSKTCIMAEFDYDLNPLETFPVNQAKERRTMYHVKATGLPIVYWNMMLKGRWGGPKFYRKLLHLGMSK